MYDSSHPLSYPSFRIILTFLNFKKRKEVAERVPSIQNIEKKIPIYLRSVQFTEDWAANCYSLWIDGMVIRFENSNLRDKVVTVVTDKKSTRDVDESVIDRCLKYHLNKPNVRIRQLTINKASWPSENFFPERVKSLKIITNSGTEKSLRKFKHMQFDRVIVDNRCKNSKIFTLPMVYKAKNLLINSVEMLNNDLLQMPLESSVTIRKECILDDDFTDFCEKLLNSENLETGVSYTGTYHRKNFNFKTVLNAITVRTNIKKTTWNGRKSWTVNINTDLELVVMWDVTGTVFEPKNHVTALVLKRGSSNERVPGVIQNLNRSFKGLKPV